MHEIEYNATAQFINELFLEIKARCPAWAVAWPNEKIELKARAIWTEAFIRNKIKDVRLIQNGLKRLDGHFIPTVEQFLDLCKPRLEDFNLPSVEDAFKIALKIVHDAKYPTYRDGKFIEHQWPHDAIRLAAQDTGHFEILNNQKAFNDFKRHYLFYTEKLMNGETLETVLKPLPDSENLAPRKTLEVGKSALSELKKHLGTEPYTEEERIARASPDELKKVEFHKYLINKMLERGVNRAEALRQLNLFQQRPEYAESLQKFVYKPKSSGHVSSYL